MLPALVALSVGMASPNTAFSAAKQKKESLPIAVCPDTQSLSGKFPNYFWKVKEPTLDSALTETATLSIKGASYGAKVKFPKSWKVVPQEEDAEDPAYTLELRPIDKACVTAGPPGGDLTDEWCTYVMIRVRPKRKEDQPKFTGKEPSVDYTELGVRYRSFPMANGEKSTASGVVFSLLSIVRSYPDVCNLSHRAISNSDKLRFDLLSSTVVKAKPGILSKDDGQIASEAASIINSIQFIK